jgi:hypothetical protein
MKKQVAQNSDYSNSQLELDIHFLFLTKQNTQLVFNQAMSVNFSFMLKIMSEHLKYYCLTIQNIVNIIQ